MIDQATCPHDDTVPVDVRDHTTGGTVTVARICRGCLAQLEAGWGCPRCVWEQVEEPRRLCEPANVAARIVHVLTRPCQEHA